MKPIAIIHPQTGYLEICLHDGSNQHMDFSFYFALFPDDTVKITYGRYPDGVLFRKERITAQVYRHGKTTRDVHFSDLDQSEFTMHVRIRCGQKPEATVEHFSFPKGHPLAFLSNPAFAFTDFTRE